MFWSRLVLVALCFLCSATARAEVKAVLTGPEEAEAGDLVVIDATGSIGDGFKFRVDERLVGRVFAIDRRVIFATRTPGLYQFQVIVADREARIDEVTLAVKVGEIPPPTPPEPPKPPPPPGPPPLPPVDVDPQLRSALTAGFATRKTEAAIWSGMLLGMGRVVESDATKQSGPRLKTMADVDELRNLIVRAPSQPVSGGDVIAPAIGPGLAAIGGPADKIDEAGRRAAVAKLLIGAATVLDEVSR